MKEITLKMDPKVYRDIKTHIQLKTMGGSFGGIADCALAKIISAIEDDKKEVELKYKGDRK